jgi:hypothetical protein
MSALPSTSAGEWSTPYTDADGNVIDTASNYRGGSSEEIVGELLEGRRDRYVVATKFTVTRDGTDPNAAGSHRKISVSPWRQAFGACGRTTSISSGFTSGIRRPRSRRPWRAR